MRKYLLATLALLMVVFGSVILSALPAFAHTGNFEADCQNLYFNGIRFPAGVTTQVHLSGTVGGHTIDATEPLVGPAQQIKTDISQWTTGQKVVTGTTASWVWGHKQQTKTIGPVDVPLPASCSTPMQNLSGTTTATSRCVIGSGWDLGLTVTNTGDVGFKILATTVPNHLGLGATVTPKQPLQLQTFAPASYAQRSYQLQVQITGGGHLTKTLTGVYTGQVPTGKCQPTTPTQPANVPTAPTPQATSPSTSQSGGSSLPFTGGDVVGLTLIGIGATAGGTALVRKGRRPAV